MSDGNFNRALLPKNELSAGIRAGKAQMRTKAQQALRRLLEERMPDMPDEGREALVQRFMELLRQL